MPAKKAASKSSSSSDMNTVWMWVYALGMVIAGVLGGIGFSNDIVSWLLLLAAVLVGWFYFDSEDLGQFGLRVVALWVAQAGLSMVPAVGAFITGFFGGWLFFLFPVVLAMGVHFFWNRRIAPLF